MVDIRQVKQGLKTAGKVGLEYTPYVGDVWDISRGGYQAFHGHPFIGTGQALLGGAGLAANILFPGSGSVAKAGVKAGVKGVIRKGIEKLGGSKALKTGENIAKKLHSVPVQAASAITPELLYGMNNTNIDNNQEQLPQQQSNTQQQNSISKTIGRVGKPSGYVNGNTNLATPEEVMNILSGGTPSTLEGIPIQQNEQPQTNNDILNRLAEYYEQQKEYRRPYLEGLQSYAENYNDLNRRAFNMDRYLAGIAGWSGNDNFARMMGRYNPATVEATKLDLLNKLAEEQSKELNLGNEVVGNAAVLQQAGLPLEAVFANPNLIKNASSIMNARTNAEARRYVADQAYKAKVYDTWLDNKIRQEINNGRMANARQLAQLRENNRYNIAVLQAQAYGYNNNQTGNVILPQ